MKYEFTNDNHKTSHRMSAPNGVLTAKSVERLKRRLCRVIASAHAPGLVEFEGSQKRTLVDRPGGSASIMRSHEA